MKISRKKKTRTGVEQGTNGESESSSSASSNGGDNPTNVVLGEDQLEQMRLAKEQFEKEKEKRINSVPKENVEGFRKIGFGKWGKLRCQLFNSVPMMWKIGM